MLLLFCICSVSGCTDHFEEDEESALETTRNIVATLNVDQCATPSGVNIDRS